MFTQDIAHPFLWIIQGPALWGKIFTVDDDFRMLPIAG